MSNNGREAIVARIPDCDIHKYDKGVVGIPAAYDAKTKQGPWANMCEECFGDHAAYLELGTGRGQRLVLKTD